MAGSTDRSIDGCIRPIKRCGCAPRCDSRHFVSAWWIAFNSKPALLGDVVESGESATGLPSSVFAADAVVAAGLATVGLAVAGFAVGA
jgi:hypothetical protein